MNKVGMYGAYQNTFYGQSVTKNNKNNETSKKEEVKEAATFERSSKAAKKEDAVVSLSSKAKDLLEELKKKYGNMDFIVADYETDEEAAQYLAHGRKEYSVLIDPETLEEMAADEEVRAKYEGILQDATGELKNLSEKLKEEGTEVRNLGVTIGKDGIVSYFAELDKMNEKQRERIEKSKEDKKEEAKRAEKKSDKKANDKEKAERVRVYAQTIEDLIAKIKKANENKEEKTEKVGMTIDFTV